MAVVGPQYCCPYPVDLAIVRKVMTIADKFTVTDLNGNVVFKLQASLLTLCRRVLVDAARNPVVTLRRKIMTTHDIWQAFRGYSTDPKDLTFTLGRSSLIRLGGTKLNVFLASNTSEQVCDFNMKGSWLERSCAVYAGESNTIVAQTHKKHKVQSVVFEKTNFIVTVYPNVDYAFVVALIAILDEINQDRR